MSACVSNSLVYKLHNVLLLGGQLQSPASKQPPASKVLASDIDSLRTEDYEEKFKEYMVPVPEGTCIFYIVMHVYVCHLANCCEPDEVNSKCVL